MKTVMQAWLPGMSDPTEQAQQLVHKFETEGGIIAEIDDDENTVRIELVDGQSFWISQEYLEKKPVN